MHLKTDHALGVTWLFEISGLHAIHEALIVISLDHDPVVVPFPFLECSLSSI